MNLLIIVVLLPLYNCLSLANYQKVQLYGNQTFAAYFFEMYLGNPPQKQSLILDTGSNLMNIKCGSQCENCGEGLYKNYQTKESTTSTPVFCDTTQFSCSNSCSQKKTQDECMFRMDYFGFTSGSKGVIRKDQADLSRNPTKSKQFEVSFLCATSFKTSGTIEDINGIFGFSPAALSNQIFSWFRGKSEEVAGSIGVCLAKNGGYFQLGVNPETPDSSQNVIISQYTPLKAFLETMHVTEMKMGSLDLFDKQKIQNGVAIDTGSGTNIIPPKKAKLLYQLTDKICVENAKNCQQFSVETRRCYVLDNPSITSSLQDYLDKIFPAFEVTLNSSIITTKPRDYFINLKSTMQTGVFCVGFQGREQQIEGQTYILGIPWLVNKKLTFNLDEGYMQIRPDSNCSYDQKNLIYEPHATIQSIISYFILLMVFVLIVFVPKLAQKWSTLKAKVSRKRAQLVEQGVDREDQAYA